MSNNLSTEDRRNVRRSLITSTAVLFSLLFGTLAWAGVHPPAAETRAVAPSAAAPAVLAAAGETPNEDVGCGCAESCLVSR